MRPARLGDGLEVTVTRKYYRSGESEYYINKRQVRLKDIYELFYDTGIGREGYSVISQGKISEVLSQKGDERRSIFEEAAGISKIRYKKLESERKLRDTEQNLLPRQRHSLRGRRPRRAAAQGGRKRQALSGSQRGKDCARDHALAGPHR